TTDFRGYYSFKQRPSATTQYRTVADGVTSERQVAVDVAPLLTLRVGPAGRKTLRYSGTLLPAHDGQTVAIQRRGTSGAWTTVASPRLHGTKFQGRMRARKPAILRAFFATDGDHLDGFSPAVDWAPGARATVS